MTVTAQSSPAVTGALVPPNFGLTKFLDALNIPPVLRPRAFFGLPHLTVRMQATEVRLHSQLPPTPAWGYDGYVPGPTIEVRRGERVRISWTNEITGPYPLVAAEVPNDPAAPPSNVPGRGGVDADPDVAALPAWTVVHLHGARTGGGNDGWAENAVLTGNSQLSEYPNDQQAMGLWYHDHGMDITRWNVMTGLAGMYLIRDDEEDALHLPHGKYEVPLMLCDRNLETDGAGQLTGQLLYKVAYNPPPPGAERVMPPFSGPFTLVNGVIWPHLDVEPRWYRLRMLNAANARFFQLQLQHADGTTDQQLQDAVRQIGSDGGLLPAPVALPGGKLILAPAERADLLINFAAFKGQSLKLSNIAPNKAPEPDVMEFRVRNQPVSDHFVLPTKLAKSFTRLTHDTLPDHEHRMVMLTPPGASHPEIWEMEQVDNSAGPSQPGEFVDGIVQVLAADSTLKTYMRMARTFDDQTNFKVMYEGWELWNVLNLSPVVAHPVHLHLIEFQALSRNTLDISGYTSKINAAGAVEGGTITGKPIAIGAAAPIDENEQGWKDVIRANGGQLVSIAGQFGGATGRFMYHCHILDHEDEGMMRAFVVMPMEAMKFEHGPHGGHQH